MFRQLRDNTYSTFTTTMDLYKHVRDTYFPSSLRTSLQKKYIHNVDFEEKK